MNDLEKMIEEKRNLRNNIESLINDFQGKYGVDLKVSIIDSDIKEMCNNYSYKECSIKKVEIWSQIST